MDNYSLITLVSTVIVLLLNYVAYTAYKEGKGWWNKVKVTLIVIMLLFLYLNRLSYLDASMIKGLKDNQQITYRVDSWGGQVIGVVDDKFHAGDSYNIVIDKDYFEVNESQYNEINKGDKVIGYLRKGE